MPAAYVIVDMKVQDQERYKQYMAAAPVAVAAHGGSYLARGGAQETLEGDWHPARIVILHFPSLAAAKTFYDAEQYRAARALRAGTTEFFNMVVVEGAPE